MIVYSGIGGSPYQARGILHFWGTCDDTREVHAPPVSDDPETQTARFHDAASALAKTLDEYYKNAVLRVGEAEAEIFAAQKMMLTAE